MRLSLAAFASVALAATTVIAAPSAQAQEAPPADPAMQSDMMQPGMKGGSYTRSMMTAKNDTTGANSIASIAMSDPQFSTLVRLVKIAGLDNSLMYRGPLTVFAPTNEAFDKLPKGTLRMLEQPENIKYLQAILMYHLVPGGYNAADVTALNGQNLSTTSRMNPLMVAAGPSINYGGGSTSNATTASNTSGMSTSGTARIVRPDIMASNGVIHVIDTVLLPPLDMMMQQDRMLLAKSKADMDKSLFDQAREAQKSTAEQLKERPLGGPVQEPAPRAEQPKTP